MEEFYGGVISMSDNNQKLTQVEKVVIKLRKMILSHELKAGQRLIQDEISKSFGVSKIPVREGLKVLESEGLVYSETYKGSFVNDISVDFIEETYYLRSVLEGISCSKATNMFTQENLSELKDLIKKAEEAYLNNDVLNFTYYSKLFHTYIHKLSPFKRLRLIIENLNHALLPYNITNLKEGGRKSIEEHYYIFDKIKQDDSLGAGNAMTMHLQRAGLDTAISLKEKRKAD